MIQVYQSINMGWMYHSWFILNLANIFLTLSSKSGRRDCLVNFFPSNRGEVALRYIRRIFLLFNASFHNRFATLFITAFLFFFFYPFSWHDESILQELNLYNVFSAKEKATNLKCTSQQSFEQVKGYSQQLNKLQPILSIQLHFKDSCP